mmetsp:Transcript_46829/g.77760  ORF Transcript_46829/g.77760 Transcript_46829/m.77760 type:complete len:331 (-) Transcript_46829:174-1166(-)
MGCESTDNACHKQWQAVHITALVPSVLSIIASVCIIIIGITYHRRLRSLGLSAQLPIFISLCDLGFELSHGGDHLHNLLADFVSEGALCQFFGCLKPFFINCQTTWALSVAFFVNRSVLAERVPTYGPHNVYLHAFCWGVPLIILVGGFAFDVYGVEGPWCGITNHVTDFWMVDVWMSIAICLLAVNYAWIIYHIFKVMKKRQHVHAKNSSRKAIRNALPIMSLFPVAYALQWIFYGLYKTHVLANTYGNVLLVVCTANMGGVYNFALYGRMLFNFIRKKLRQQVKDLSANNDVKTSSGGTAPNMEIYVPSTTVDDIDKPDVDDIDKPAQ